MNKYIKIDVSNNIIDVFFDYQKNKKDGTEILIESDVVAPFKNKINDKSISDEFGNFIFTWDGSISVEKDQATKDAQFLIEYKKEKRDELRRLIKENWLDIDKTVTQIKTQWTNVKADAVNWTTIAEVDTAFDNAITWLGL